MKNRSTIQIPKEVREALKGRKKYSRETYEDVIKRLIKRDKRKVTK